jgi:exodeoxyribonuclease VII large subunit
MMQSPSPYSDISSSAEAPVLRVSQAIAVCNNLLRQLAFRVEGEVAGYSVSQGKFVFFDLKDEETEARVNCFMMLYQLPTPLENGMRVVVEAKPGIHQKSGKFSLTVTRVDPKGQGSVKRSFELLLKKLTDEGLFAPERKRQLPRFPSRVGIISSADAAGFGDFKKIALSRLPGITFIMASVAVQGREAEKEICQAFEHLNGHHELDCIVLIRGGGSIEDLHAFNSEPVARAIARSKAPVLVGVGHEKDVTIADYVADKRAATPSNAAQILLPTLEEVRDEVIRLTQDGRRQVERTIQLQRQQLLASADRRKQQLLYVVSQHRAATQAMLKTVEAISPQQTLARGYSITTTLGGELVTSSSQLTKGDQIVTQLADGRLHSQLT